MSQPTSHRIPTVDGLKLDAIFYSAGQKRPCIIMTAGVSGLKEHFLPDFAARFQEKGYSVLIYDNRCWGGSEGLPRNHADAQLQQRDYLDAFNFATTLPDVDPQRIVLWGSSLSGGNAIMAAVLERRACAIIAQVPFVSGELAIEPMKDLLAPVLQERAAIAQGAEPIRIPVMIEKDEKSPENSHALLKDESAIPFMAEMESRGIQWEKSITLQSALAIGMSEPQAFIHRVAPTPLLMVVGRHDVTCSTEKQLAAYAKASEPKSLKILEGANHFTPYYGDNFEENIQAQLAFLQKHVLQESA